MKPFFLPSRGVSPFLKVIPKSLSPTPSFTPQSLSLSPAFLSSISSVPTHRLSNNPISPSLPFSNSSPFTPLRPSLGTQRRFLETPTEQQQEVIDKIRDYRERIYKKQDNLCVGEKVSVEKLQKKISFQEIMGSAKESYILSAQSSKVLKYLPLRLRHLVMMMVAQISQQLSLLTFGWGFIFFISPPLSLFFLYLGYYYAGKSTFYLPTAFKSTRIRIAERVTNWKKKIEGKMFFLVKLREVLQNPQDPFLKYAYSRIVEELSEAERKEYADKITLLIEKVQKNEGPITVEEIVPLIPLFQNDTIGTLVEKLNPPFFMLTASPFTLMRDDMYIRDDGVNSLNNAEVIEACEKRALWVGDNLPFNCPASEIVPQLVFDCPEDDEKIDQMRKELEDWMLVSETFDITKTESVRVYIATLILYG